MSWTLFIEVGIFALLMGIVAWALFVPPRNTRMKSSKKNGKDKNS